MMNGAIEAIDREVVGTLVSMRDRVFQKQRVAFNNRVKAIESGRDQADTLTTDILARYTQRFASLESEVTEDIELLIADWAIVENMCGVKGVGKMMAAKLVSFLDPALAPHISSFWKRAGMGVTNGAADRPHKGERIEYNPWLKSTCFVLASCLLRANSPYRTIYDSSKEYYQLNRPEWTKGHIHAAARRRMIKVFLGHLHLTWRVLEGLSVDPPYITGKNGHHYRYKCVDFGWPELEERDRLERAW